MRIKNKPYVLVIGPYHIHNRALVLAAAFALLTKSHEI
jgi:hypothetical protein